MQFNLSFIAITRFRAHQLKVSLQGNALFHAFHNYHLVFAAQTSVTMQIVIDHEQISSFIYAY